jgi:PAS domain S-box-containing protein
MSEDSEYLLEPLREGTDFTLYRGTERGGQTPILAVAVAAEQPSRQNLLRLEHEYSLATELDAAWAAQPLALSRYRGRAVLILRDPGGAPLDRIIEQQNGHPIDLTRFLRIAIGLAAALSQAHRQGLIHKDVKPENALVDDSGRVWLTGFGIASRLSRERQSPEAPEFIAGSLAYMAPEQTGRMNRSIDTRSDLYSLGITLYEILTGNLPFSAADPMEWVHCQIARQPVSPRERTPSVPGPISAIIMKLMAKTAEERYQTAVGLEHELQRCLKEWETHGRIDEFPLGEQDISDRLLIPERLYGRESEIDVLLASFERVVGGGRPELVLVSGYSGVGKSSLVNELHKPLVPPRGLFASGKFDQYKRDIPYATLAQAFRNIIRPILAKNEKELGRWCEAIREALGPNGQLMVDLVPELKLIIGEQQPVPELPPRDAQSRFQLVFRRFISAFTREYPLALFLDDLQWLDAATLDLMEDLLTQPEGKNLMLIGAYRDNEVPAAHPLMRKLQAMRQAGAIVHDIVLAPLTLDDLTQLLADTLHCKSGHVGPLAASVEERTSGNPFFAIQFISALFEEGLLTFDHLQRHWRWDLNRIHAKGFTDNVVDLMVGKLNRLHAETQKALQQLACLGNSADLATLRVVYQDSSLDMHGQLWEAVQAGFLFRSEDSYRFLHDRVQEAAYSLIPQELRAEAHLRIGRLMASHTSADKLEEVIFEIVNQLNRASGLITSIAERERTAQLNLIAGRRAKLSTAYASALKYLCTGRALLTDEAWDRNYELVFALETLMAECDLHTADMVAAEGRLVMLVKRARTRHDFALVTRLQVTLYTTLDRSDRAIEVFLDYLRQNGTDWPPHPARDDVMREYKRIWSLLGNRQVEDLMDVSLLKDPDVLDMLDVFTEIVHPAMFSDENLSTLVVCRMVSLCLEHGNCDASCFGYVWFGMFAGPRFNNYKDGFRFGQLGYDLVEKRGLTRYQARTYLSFGTLMPWAKHAAKGRELIRRAFDVAYRSGDLTFSAYSWHSLITSYLAVGDPLPVVQLEVEKGLDFVKRLGFGLVTENCSAQLGFIRTLRGLTSTFGCFDARDYSESETERRLASNPALALAEFFYWTRKLQARFFAGDYASAVEASRRAHQLLWPAASQVETGDFRFYAALARAAIWHSVPSEERQRHFAALNDHHGQLEIWALHCPANFETKTALVGAEIARIEGRDLDTMRLYEQAIRSARANEFVHNEGLAHELAAKFYLASDIETAGYAHLRNARGCYDRWGAIGKVKQLDERYPRLREWRTTASLATIGPLVLQMDVETVVKASQALSSEMFLPKLIERLMRLAMEHAGAERGLLILIRGAGPQIEAEATTGPRSIEVAVRQEPVTPSDLPQSALHYVIRTQESVILDDASAHDVHSTDEYIVRKASRSVLCLPIVNQKKLVGALYLENHLAPFVFTPDRVAVLQLLASQAAISLENAALYTDLQRSEAFLAQGQRISRTGSFGWSVAGGENYWSEENYNILEYDRDAHASVELLFQRMHPDDRDYVRRALEDAVREKTDFDSEHRLLMPDGRVKHVHTTGRALNTGNLDFVGAVRDITERMRSEEALRQAQDDLARINRVTIMGELAASLAHELSQPISGAVTNANTCTRKLARDNPDLDEVRAVVARFARDAQRAAAILGRIRTQFQRGALNREVIDVNEINRETVALLRDETLRYNISVRTELAADLPLIIGDRVLLQQVAMNLIVNSIEAMKDVDGIREVIITSQRTENEQILVSVSDTGIGFPLQMAERIFDAFFTTKTHGTGMGLRISRSIIDSHSGRLWAVGTPGRGATFHWSLPAAR